MPACVPLAVPPGGPIPVSAARVLLDRFRRSHMRSPRGRGGWLFENDDGVVVFSASGQWAEACAAARRFSAAHGIQLWVCP